VKTRQVGGIGREHKFVNTCNQSTNNKTQKTVVQNTVQISAKAQKIEFINQHLDELSDEKLERIIKIVVEVKE